MNARAKFPTVAEMQAEVDAARTVGAVSRLLLQPLPDMTQVTWIEARALVALGIDVEERASWWGEVRYFADANNKTVARLIYEELP